ncbi:hypothetical protein INR49_024472 [Caranx melampygus]|nr:hypothetical protein INR49_024472 [Caranx melampygus]
MSQSHNPTDSQVLLQSMLQRLKLQSEREGQSFLHTPVPTTAASTLKEGGGTGASNLQRVNNNPANGFEFGTNGIRSRQFGISGANSNFGLRGGNVQQPGHDRGLVSFPSQKDNTHSNTGENRVWVQATSPGITSTGTGQLFPAKSLKNADTTSFERTDRESVSFVSSPQTRHIPDNKDAVTRLGQNQVQDQSFKPKVYVWSPTPTDANPGTESQENKVLLMGNGQSLEQSKDIQFAANSQSTTRSSLRRNQRSSEKKTRRWTQKLKERWLDRKKREEGEQTRGMSKELSLFILQTSPQNQLHTAENLINTSNKEQDSKASMEDSTPDGHVRSSSDFEFGLGSFSLLEEIITGQEWATFLNLKHPVTSANQRPSEEPLRNSLWSFRGTEPSNVSGFSMAQISPAASLPVSMGKSEGKQQHHVHTTADLSVPMEDLQSGERAQKHHQTSPSFVVSAGNQDAALKKVSLNRKRQHQSATRVQTEKISDVKGAGRGTSMNMSSSRAMDESQHDNFMTDSPAAPLSPSSFNPFAPAPRGVLKHSLSLNSGSSTETVTKRMRVEENRRVHFSEMVVSIAAPELDMDATDSEEDPGAEEDSLTGQDFEVEQAGAAAAMEEVAPARRPVLPTWIQALKKRNMGRKHR